MFKAHTDIKYMYIYVSVFKQYLFNKFELKSQNENSDRQVPSQVTYCKEKKIVL